jgi:hypothetical protein
MERIMSYLSEHPQVQQLVHKHRDAINQSVRARMAAGAKLDGADLLNHLDTSIGPIMTAILESMPERASSALLDLTDVSLDLLSAGLLIPNSTDSLLTRLWIEILPALATPLALQPKRIAASLCNAMVQITQRSPSAARRWFDALLRLSPSLRDPDLVLATGTLLGWTSGLPQYRHSALNRAASIPQEIVARCLGLEPPVPTSNVIGRTLESLRSDPWTRLRSDSNSPAQNADASAKQLHAVGRVGCFRGLGGSWLTPPRVWHSDHGLLASDGLATYQIHADRFGAALTRIQTEQHSVPPPQSSLALSDPPQTTSLPLRVTPAQKGKGGKLTWGNRTLLLDGIERHSSLACDGHTVAWTLPDSFHIFLVALVSEDDPIQIPHSDH